jgi:5'-3' exonuclease
MLALIDADIVCYRIGFASEEETDKVAIYRAGEFMEDLVMKPYVSDYKGFLTGSNNFRMQIAKTQPYKGNRKQPKPKHYDILREYLVQAWACEVVEGQEADDAIGIQAYSMDVEDYIIMSIDKDLDMIRGNHYNFIKNNKYFVGDDEAIRHFYHQILTGDRTDNIPGLAGIGPKKADKILQDAISEKDMYEAVLKAYDNNEEYLCEQANLLWIRRESGQIWTPPK